jgi:hypothetical protein
VGFLGNLLNFIRAEAIKVEDAFDHQLMGGILRDL